MPQTITTSMSRAFKSCRRVFELQYVENLKPRETPEALSTGSAYHDLIEQVLLGKEYERTNTVQWIMAEKFKERILPLLPAIHSVEQEFKVKIARGKYLVGKIDAIAKDWTPIEHKTTKDMIDEKYIYKLQWDEQVTDYLIALSIKSGRIINKVIYTVVRKPSITPKMIPAKDENGKKIVEDDAGNRVFKKDGSPRESGDTSKGYTLKQEIETEEEYFNRCLAWYDEDTDKKIATFPVVRSKQELVDRQEELIDLMKEVKKCKRFYKNPRNCAILGCQYSSICLSYVPEIGSPEFVKKESRNEELNGNYNK